MKAGVQKRGFDSGLLMRQSRSMLLPQQRRSPGIQALHPGDAFGSSSLQLASDVLSASKLQANAVDRSSGLPEECGDGLLVTFRGTFPMPVCMCCETSRALDNRGGRLYANYGVF